MTGGSASLLDQDHRAIVVGAGGAIGRAICLAYSRAGARVGALDMEAQAATSAVRPLAGDNHWSATIDVTDLDCVRAAARAALVGERISSLVYAAGVTITADVVSTDWEEYERLMAVNLRGAFYVAYAFGSRMLAEPRGTSMAFLASNAGKHGEAGGAAYCASKFGVLGLVESFAAEAGPAGMRVNAICPGNVDSPMLRTVADAEAAREQRPVDAVLADYAAVAAERRLVRPEEVANACVWLASPLASGINGESINVDAGALTG